MTATASVPVTEILALLKGVRRAGDGWAAKCPAHDDRQSSLSISTGKDSRALVMCHAGCALRDIVAAIGLTMADLFVKSDAHKSNGNGKYNGLGKIVKTYSYRDDDGSELFQVARYEPKTFRQRRCDGSGGFTWNMDGVKRVLYRYPELLNAREDRPDDWVFIVEGEKDADRIAEAGLVATCNPGGAESNDERGKKWRPEFSEALSGMRCCIIADKDQTGRHHGQIVARSLCAAGAADVRVIEVPGNACKDASDWFSAGGTADELVTLAENASSWTPAPPLDGEENGSSTSNELTPEPLADLWASDPELREPVLDGILRRGQVGNIIAASKSYKTYLILALLICMVAGRFWLDVYATFAKRVLLIDLELQRPDITKRTIEIAKAMHAPLHEVSHSIDVLSFRGKRITIADIEKILLAYPPRHYDAVVIDPLYKVYEADFDENNNAQMTQLYRRFERIAEHLDCAVVIVHHASKGAQDQKRTVDVGAGAGAQARSPDAHGALREHETEGCMVLDWKVRSFRPPDPIVIRWSYPLWTRDTALDPTKLKTGRKARNNKDDTPKEPKTEWDGKLFAETYITDKPRDKRDVIALANTSGNKLSERRASSLLRMAVADGHAFEWRYPKDRCIYLANVAQPVTAILEQKR